MSGDQSSPARGRRPLKWRPWLRALHRDAGYFVIGLTVIYALSGLAVNHITDWDPSFHQIERTHQVQTPIPEDDAEAAQAVLSALGVSEKPSEVYRADDSQLDIVLAQRTLHVDTESGKVLEEGQSPRFFLRLANWLHLNRGKKAWTYVADGYAAGLMILALSGMFMIAGRKGLIGRGAVLVGLGIAVPVLYVTFAGP